MSTVFPRGDCVSEDICIAPEAECNIARST